METNGVYNDDGDSHEEVDFAFVILGSPKLEPPLEINNESPQVAVTRERVVTDLFSDFPIVFPADQQKLPASNSHICRSVFGSGLRKRFPDLARIGDRRCTLLDGDDVANKRKCPTSIDRRRRRVVVPKNRVW